MHRLLASRKKTQNMIKIKRSLFFLACLLILLAGWLYVSFKAVDLTTGLAEWSYFCFKVIT